MISLKNTSKYLFFCFLTLCIVNGMIQPVLHQLGQYGKIIIVLGSLIFFLGILPNIKRHIMIRKELLFLGIIFLLFIYYSLMFYLNNNANAFTYSLLFICYLIFIFLIVNFNLINNRSENNLNEYYNFFKLYQKIFIFNIILWFAVALVLNLPMIGQDIGGRTGFGGFYGARMAFGLLSVTGFIVSFYLYQEEIFIQKKRYQLFLTIIFLLLIMSSDSRTPQFIGIILVIHYYINKRLKYLLILIAPFIIFYFLTVVDLDRSSDLNTISSGRVFIWDLVFKELLQNGIFNGYGVYNLNDLILEKYRHVSDFFRHAPGLSFHSSYIELMAAGGLFSIIIFLYFNYKIYIKSSNIYQSMQISLLIGGIFESYIMSPNMPISMLYWIVVFIQIRINALNSNS